MLQHRCDGADGEARGVGAQHGLGPRQGFDLLEDGLLQVHDFRHRFDDEIGCGDGLAEVADRMQVGRPCRLLFLRGLATGDALVPKRADALHACSKAVGVGVMQVSAPPCLGAHLRDAGAHGSGSDDGDGGDLHALSGHATPHQAFVARWARLTPLRMSSSARTKLQPSCSPSSR